MRFPVNPRPRRTQFFPIGTVVFPNGSATAAGVIVESEEAWGNELYSYGQMGGVARQRIKVGDAVNDWPFFEILTPVEWAEHQVTIEGYLRERAAESRREAYRDEEMADKAARLRQSVLNGERIRLTCEIQAELLFGEDGHISLPAGEMGWRLKTGDVLFDDRPSLPLIQVDPDEYEVITWTP